MKIDSLLLEMDSITKEFPGVRALDSVSFTLQSNEVHCLAGENGAGKSTLMKILSGAYQPDSGKILIDGEPVRIPDPLTAQQFGIAEIYQELDLVPTLNATENIFLGHEIRTLSGNLSWRKMYSEAQKILASLEVTIDLKLKVGALSIAHKQLVNIAKALSTESRILIMDEPSAVLAGNELDILFNVIRKLKEEGLGIIYISHRLREIFEIGDRVTVLKDGKYIMSERVANTSSRRIINAMVGRDLRGYFVKSRRKIGDVALSVKNIEKRGAFQDISFSIREGEILGLAGMIGAGRTAVAKAIIGADPVDQGEIYLHGKRISVSSPSEALEAGIGLIPEDRRKEGFVGCRSIKENISLAVLGAVCNYGFVNFKELDKITEKYFKDLGIKAQSQDVIVENLSGGNQQKVVLAKWLAAECEVLIMDEPTRGIDVGVKAEVFQIMDKLASEGKAIIMISSELPEILSMSDRILVLSEGRITKELFPDQTSEEEILEYALPSYFAS